eukprot:6172466-Pleurochrysis_carterae.AAC.3
MAAPASIALHIAFSRLYRNCFKSAQQVDSGRAVGDNELNFTRKLLPTRKLGDANYRAQLCTAHCLAKVSFAHSHATPITAHKTSTTSLNIFRFSAAITTGISVVLKALN